MQCRPKPSSLQQHQNGPASNQVWAGLLPSWQPFCRGDRLVGVHAEAAWNSHPHFTMWAWRPAKHSSCRKGVCDCGWLWPRKRHRIPVPRLLLAWLSYLLSSKRKSHCQENSQIPSHNGEGVWANPSQHQQTARCWLQGGRGVEQTPGKDGQRQLASHFPERHLPVLHCLRLWSLPRQDCGGAPHSRICSTKASMFQSRWLFQTTCQTTRTIW